MAGGQFIQMSSVALHVDQGTVRETTVTVLYALDSLGKRSRQWVCKRREGGVAFGSQPTNHRR
jgi:hypothetical protein